VSRQERERLERVGFAVHRTALDLKHVRQRYPAQDRLATRLHAIEQEARSIAHEALEALRAAETFAVTSAHAAWSGPSARDARAKGLWGSAAAGVAHAAEASGTRKTHPCPDPAVVALAGAGGGGKVRLVCASHAAHPSASKLRKALRVVDEDEDG